MDFVVTENYQTLGREGADAIVSVIAIKPDAAVVLATGETPMGVYQELVARCKREEIDTSRLRVFQLDEYLGLAPDDRRSLHRWMEGAVTRPLGIPAGNVVRLSGGTRDPRTACREYDEAVKDVGGFDLAVLGLGPNGHLGFNEPPSGPQSTTRTVDLAEESVESNARYWGGRNRVPRRAITAGMDVLLSARRILLIVSGAHKRGILRRVACGPVTSDAPASYLQRASGVTVLADKAAWPPDLAAGNGCPPGR